MEIINLPGKIDRKILEYIIEGSFKKNIFYPASNSEADIHLELPDKGDGDTIRLSIWIEEGRNSQLLEVKGEHFQQKEGYELVLGTYDIDPNFELHHIQHDCCGGRFEDCVKNLEKTVVNSPLYKKFSQAESVLDKVKNKDNVTSEETRQAYDAFLNEIPERIYSPGLRYKAKAKIIENYMKSLEPKKSFWKKWVLT